MLNRSERQLAVWTFESFPSDGLHRSNLYSLGWRLLGTGRCTTELLPPSACCSAQSSSTTFLRIRQIEIKALKLPGRKTVCQGVQQARRWY
jgi:hypothetical protein